MLPHEALDPLATREGLGVVKDDVNVQAIQCHLVDLEVLHLRTILQHVRKEQTRDHLAVGSHYGILNPTFDCLEHR